MNPKTNPVIEQWIRDAERDFRIGGMSFAASCARHAPQNQPAPSIWRPVSVKPMLQDANLDGNVALHWEDGTVTIDAWSFVGERGYGSVTHWTRTADLLALAPLPKVKTQAELDDEFVAACVMNSETTPDNIHRAIAYGRATAKGAAQ